MVLALLALGPAEARAAEKTWTGGAGDGLWASASNWSPSGAPASGDNVTIDNTTASGTFTVTLPTGATTVSISKLTITPGAGNTITVVLPSGNTAAPGLQVGDSTAATDDIILNSGAILKNSSGAGSGNGIEANTTANGTVRINNGARYIHNTARSTGGVVPVLSTATGTETGIFEYDSPGTGSVSISASGRNYGSLTLTRTAGAATYTAAGGSALGVRGNLTINSGVTLSSSMTGPLNLGGSLTNNGAALTIPASGLGQAVVFNGSAVQKISGSGAVTFGAGGVTVNSGATLAVGKTVTFNAATAINGTFRIDQGGWATGSGTWTYGSSATLEFANPSPSYTVNNTDVFWPTTSGPQNVNVSGAGGLTLNSASRTIPGTFQTSSGVTLTSSTLTLNGTCQINAGGYFANAPTYGSSSTLKYNTGGTYSRYNEWSSTSGAGYPNNVQVANNTTLNLPNGSGTDRACAGNLTIDSGSALYQDYGGGSVKLTVGKAVALNGSLSLGGAVGGDLYLGGDWTRTGTFIPNGRAVFFDGTAAQAINSTTTFDYLYLTNSAGVTLNANVTANNASTIQKSGKLNLNGYTLAGPVTVDPEGRLYGVGSASGSVAVSGTVAPGASIGTLATGSETWAGGGAYEFEINDATGTAGSSPGWDLLAITGGLNISATSGSKFTITNISLGGAIANFDSAKHFGWKLATVSGTISSFNESAFAVDNSGFANAFTGTFHVTTNGNNVYLYYQPLGCDTTGKGHEVVSGKMEMYFTNLTGLKSVAGTVTTNCTIAGYAYNVADQEIASGFSVTTNSRMDLPPGTTRLKLVATKEGGGDAWVNVIVKDYCDIGAYFDPVVTTLEVLAGDKVVQRFEGLLAAERYLFVKNGTPGLRRLEVNLNGRVFTTSLGDGQTLASDLGRAMHEGADNVVILTGYGDVGSSAFVTLTDTATGNEQPLAETVTLSLAQTADGLRLAWPDTLAGWNLEASTSPSDGWAAVTAVPVPVSGQLTVTVPTTGGAQFYRLHGPVARSANEAQGQDSSVTLPATTISTPNSPMKYSHENLLW